MSELRYAVIPTHDRPDKFKRALEAIRHQVDHVIVIGHWKDLGEGPDYVMPDGNVYLAMYDSPVANISEMWNLGLRAAEALATDPETGNVRFHKVAILNDDAYVAPDWFDILSSSMDEFDRTLASGRRSGYPRDEGKLAGFAFIVQGGTIKADPKWAWWVSDDHFVKEAVERFNGYVINDRAKVVHEHVDLPSSDPLMKQSKADLKAWEKGL
jgi:hypothetical protein